MVCALLVLSALAALPLAVTGAESLARARDADRFPPPGRLVDVSGARLHLLCGGAGGPTVVLISGGATPSLLSYRLLEQVAARARVCAYDRPGLGWSEPAAAPRSFDDHARELSTLLTNAGETGPYVLVGESYGGLVARAFARLWPQVTAGVVLVDAAEEAHVFANLPRMKAAERQLKLHAVLARLGILRWLVVHRPNLVGLPATTPQHERRAFAAMVSRPRYAAAARSEITAYDLVPLEQRRAGGFGGLGDTPLAVIRHGRRFAGANAFLEDGWSEAQTRLASLSTNSRLIVAERSGHAVAQTEPELVAEAIAWVRRSPSSKTAPLRAG